MLVRDADAGVEVFLMKRSMAGVFGGLHVFPGGKVDPADRRERREALGRGPSDAEASAMLGVASGGLGYWVACIRECFEEAGVLLAVRRDGALVELREPALRRRVAGYRDRLNAGEDGVLGALCAAEGFTLATDQLAYVAHWITPVDQPARYDTRFFVARAPAHQEALHDGHEAVESAWMRPEDALERFRSGGLALISPTVKNLEGLVGYADGESLLAAKRAIDPRDIPTIRPRPRPEAAAVGMGDDAFGEEVLEVIGRGGKAADA